MRHTKTVSRITGDVRCSCGLFYCEDEDLPDVEDYTMHPGGQLGGATDVFAGGRYLGRFTEETEALDAIREDMERQQFWPDVWSVSDHGNAHLISEMI